MANRCEVFSLFIGPIKITALDQQQMVEFFNRIAPYLTKTERFSALTSAAIDGKRTDDLIGKNLSDEKPEVRDSALAILTEIDEVVGGTK